MAYSVIKKELSAYIYRNILGHALIIRLRVLYSSFLLLYFFNPFVLSLSLSFSFPVCFSSVLLSFPLSSYYILSFFLPFPPSTCGSGGGSPFSLLLPSFLESSILSCKVACSLFRHHLHINAARGLAGQHLMRRQQYPQIFVFSHSYPLYDISSFTLLQGLSEALP